MYLLAILDAKLLVKCLIKKTISDNSLCSIKITKLTLVLQ